MVVVTYFISLSYKTHLYKFAFMASNEDNITATYIEIEKKEKYFKEVCTGGERDTKGKVQWMNSINKKIIFKNPFTNYEINNAM